MPFSNLAFSYPTRTLYRIPNPPTMTMNNRKKISVLITVFFLVFLFETIISHISYPSKTSLNLFRVHRVHHSGFLRDDSFFIKVDYVLIHGYHTEWRTCLDHVIDLIVL